MQAGVQFGGFDRILRWEFGSRGTCWMAAV